MRADAAVTLAEKLILTANAGSAGLVVGNGSMIKDCVASGNETGFRAFDRIQVSNCISTENVGAGFVCTSYVTIIDCTSSRNGDNGIVVGGSCTVVRCNSSRSTSRDGINAGPGCTIVDCTVGLNAGYGINAGVGCAIRNCTAQFNTESGILFSDSCHVTGNTSDQNVQSTIAPSGAGIRTFGDNNRIESNSCTSNGHGSTFYSNFLIAGHHNLLIRNSARGQGSNNFTTNSGVNNVLGPIVDMTAGGTIASTSPWAYFSY